MKYFVDTHVLLWQWLEPQRLGKKSERILHDAANYFFVAPASLLEVSYLVEIGRIDLEFDEFVDLIDSLPNYEVPAFDRFAAIQSVRLTGNRDPFDRMILGQALAAAVPIITKDKWMCKVAPQWVVF